MAEQDSAKAIIDYFNRHTDVDIYFEFVGTASDCEKYVLPKVDNENVFYVMMILIFQDMIYGIFRVHHKYSKEYALELKNTMMHIQVPEKYADIAIRKRVASKNAMDTYIASLPDAKDWKPSVSHDHFVQDNKKFKLLCMLQPTLDEVDLMQCADLFFRVKFNGIDEKITPNGNVLCKYLDVEWYD